MKQIACTRIWTREITGLNIAVGLFMEDEKNGIKTYWCKCVTELRLGQ
jgi:hypothetical protein